MPRTFKPKGGFADKSIAAIRIEDDGRSVEVLSDGNDRDRHVVQTHTHQAVPTWSLSELENLVRGGSWEEVKAEEKPAKPEPTATEDRERFVSNLRETEAAFANSVKAKTAKGDKPAT